MSRPPRTRKPNGTVAPPLVVVDGLTGTGKTTKALLLALSERIGHTWVCEFGEDTANEYALTDYDLIDHDGTYVSMMEELRCAVAAPMDPERPNLIVFDSGTGLFDMLTLWTGERARRTKFNRELLAKDKDAEITVSPNFWTDRNERFDDFVNMLRDWAGIAIVVCHGKEVTPYKDDKPVANAPKEYKVDIREYMLKQASVIVHCEGLDDNFKVLLRKCRQKPRVGVNGLEFDHVLPPGGLEITAPNPLEHVLFDVLKVGRSWQKTSMARPSTEEIVTVAQAKQGLVTRLRNCFGDDAIAEGAALWEKHGPKGLTATDPISTEVWLMLVSQVAKRISDALHPVHEAERVLSGSANPDDESSGAGVVTDPRPSLVSASNPVVKSASVAVYNLSREFGQLPGDVQAELLKWLQAEYRCTAVNVPAEHVDFVRARMEQMRDEAFPPFAEAKPKPPASRRPSVDHRERLAAQLRAKNVRGPERWKLIERITGRHVTKVESLTMQQAQLVCDTLEGSGNDAPTLLMQDAS